MQIDEKMPISEIISRWPESMKIFEKYSMGCQECMSAQYESLKQGLDAHGIDPVQFIQELNDFIQE